MGDDKKSGGKSDSKKNLKDFLAKSKGGASAKKKKWSKGKVREKLNNMVVFDQNTYERLVVCTQSILTLLLGILELHRGHLVDQLVELRLDQVPGDLALRCGRLDGTLRLLVELHNVAEHPHRLVERAVLVIRCVRVLLEVILTDDLGNLHGDLVSLGERILSDQLHDFVQVLLVLQDLLHLCAQEDECRVSFLIVRRKRLDVLGV